MRIYCDRRKQYISYRLRYLYHCHRQYIATTTGNFSVLSSPIYFLSTATIANLSTFINYISLLSSAIYYCNWQQYISTFISYILLRLAAIYLYFHRQYITATGGNISLLSSTIYLYFHHRYITATAWTISLVSSAIYYCD